MLKIPEDKDNPQKASLEPTKITIEDFKRQFSDLLDIIAEDFDSFKVGMMDIFFKNKK